MRKGCWDQKARLEDMDVNHVEASLAFPSFPRFCGQTFAERKDKTLGDLCVKAYNDWMLDEWCAGTNGRLIPLIIVQLWDAQLAADEIRRNAARGCHAVTFSEIPPFLGFPSIHDKDGYWDPFLAACEETDTVINMHIGSSSKMPSTSPDAPAAVGSTLTYMNAAMSLTDWLMSGVFERFPRLTIAYSEGQIGWIPYVLEVVLRRRALHLVGDATPAAVVLPDLVGALEHVGDPADLALAVRDREPREALEHARHQPVGE